MKIFAHRLPVVMTQQSETECGLTCLAMILDYWGCATTLRELRNELMPGRDGLTALDIVKAARHRGLEAAGESADSSVLAAYEYPVILHWDESHFVVLERWDGRAGIVVDPGWGRRRITADELESSFNGIVLNIKGERRRCRVPSIGVAKGLRSLRRLTTGLGRSIFRIVAYMGLLQVAPLLSAALVKMSMDAVAAETTMSSLAVLWSAAAAFCLAFAAISAARALLMARVSAQLDYRLSDAFISKLMRLPLAYFRTRYAGDIMFRLSSLEEIRSLLSSTLVKAVFDAISLVVYCALIIAVSRPIGLTLLVTIAVYVALICLVTRTMYQRAYAVSTEYSLSQAHGTDVLRNIELVKAMGLEASALSRWRERIRRQVRAAYELSRLQALLETALSCLQVAGPLLVVQIGAYAVLGGNLDVATLVAVMTLLGSLLAPVVGMGSTLQMLYSARATLERINDVMEESPEEDLGHGVATFNNTLELQDVTMRYRGSRQPSLVGVSCAFEFGNTIGIVGVSGSGKSSLARVLVGLERPEEGEVFYDGNSARELALSSIRTLYGVVTQEASIFAGSIRDNLTLGAGDCSADDLAEALKIAGLIETINAMPLGVNTRLSDGGGGLSGGQLQRLAIARALVRRPRILLLDEASAGLDALTEKNLYERLKEVPATKIIITHRVHTVRGADQILVLDEGRLVQAGTHEQLLQSAGRYRDLVRGSIDE